MMEHNCTSCPFNRQAMNTLSQSSFDKLNANHAVVSFEKGSTIIKQGMLVLNVRYAISKINQNQPSPPSSVFGTGVCDEA